MTLLRDLERLIEETYWKTWMSFADVKVNAGIYGLDQATVDSWKTPGEPAFVAKLATTPFAQRRLTDILESHLSPNISQGKPLVSGVFIHQKPKVKFGSPSSEIELGDILFVRHHFQSKAKSPEGRAFLLQAKSTAKPKTGKLEDKEAKQFDLYADWNTDFTFPHGDIGAPPGGAKAWNLSKGSQPHLDTGFYGLVSNDGYYANEGFPDGSPWAVGGAYAPAVGMDKEVAASGSLACALESFILGSHGRTWTLNAPAGDHWSHLVEQILEKSIGWTTRVQRIRRFDFPRRNCALALFNAFAQLNFETEIRSRNPRPGETHSSIFRSFDDFRRQGSKWVVNGGDNSTYEGKRNLNFNEERPLEPPMGMSVLYIATFGDGPLEPMREYSELRPRPR